MTPRVRLSREEIRLRTEIELLKVQRTRLFTLSLALGAVIGTFAGMLTR